MGFELQTDRLHQENEIFSSRLNLLLVGESMLLVSYVSSLALNDSIKSWLPFTLCILGILITAVFWTIINDHRKYIIKLHNKIKEEFPKVEILKENPVSTITYFLSLMIPSIFIAIWGVFLYYSII